MTFKPGDVDRVARFWQAPRVATREGLKAVQMFEAVARGKVKALWVMATNPAVSLPRAAHVRDALRKLELFVVSENVLSNDTVNAGAHVLLPATAWGEKDGTVTNSERRISRQRPFLPPPGEAKPDWWMVTEGAPNGLRRSVSLRVGGRHISRARGAVRVRERRPARLRYRGLAEVSDAAVRCARSGAVAGARGRAEAHGQPAGRAILFHGRLLYGRSQGALHRTRCRSRRRAENSRSVSTPDAYAISGIR
jgi:NADH dehydrogenase/NADH:ubiquinone oxidoreductase subunit G